MEAAFIPHMEEIYGSAQPTLSTARQQASKNNYPYFILITSTPNGIEGDGKFFYELHDKAIDSDNLFEPEFDKNGDETTYEKWRDDFKEVVKDPTKNNFIRIRYHWSEDPNKSIEWYETQKKELNFKSRQINQELDLLFVGGTNCIFEDEVLQKFSFIPRIKYFDLKHQTKIDIYQEFDPTDYYLVGVDTASSIKGAFNAVEVFSYRDFNQVAELNVRLGSLTKYGEVIDAVFKWIYQTIGERIILCIENNSIGKAIIEHLLYHVTDFSYNSFIYREKDKDDYGVQTNTRTKELMVSMLYDYIVEKPESLKSQDFIAQLSTIQRSNRGTIKSSGFSDMFMAASFCAYVRHATTLEILPLLGVSNSQIQQNFFNTVKTAAEIMNTKLNITGGSTPSSVGMFLDRPRTSLEDTMLTNQYSEETQKINNDDWQVYMPVFSIFDK